MPNSPVDGQGRLTDAGWPLSPHPCRMLAYLLANDACGTRRISGDSKWHPAPILGGEWPCRLDCQGIDFARNHTGENTKDS